MKNGPSKLSTGPKYERDIESSARIWQVKQKTLAQALDLPRNRSARPDLTSGSNRFEEEKNENNSAATKIRSTPLLAAGKWSGRKTMREPYRANYQEPGTAETR
jgi:hypothetical protein